MRRFLFVVIESSLLLLCGFFALYVRVLGDTGYELIARRGWLKLIAVTLVIQLSFYLFDLYDLPATRSYRRVIANMAIAMAVATILLSLLFYVVPALSLGRGIFLVMIAFSAVVIPGWRWLAAWSAGHPQLGVRERVLILGSGTQAIEVARATLERRSVGFHIVGFADNTPELIGKSLINPSVLGLMEDVPSLVERYEVDRIVVAVEDRRGRFPTAELLDLSLSGRVAVEECAQYYERLTGKIASEMLRPSWLIFSRNSRYSNVAHHARRIVNVSFAIIGFILSLPLMLLTAMAVKLESRGPIFYTQERVGKNGRTFRMIKFRSMRTDAEKNGAVWAMASDPRVTRVGRIIRKLRLDELPQFVNVIRGDMNFVGPRPERPVFVEQLEKDISYYDERHSVRPGLTGWAQVEYAYGATVEDAYRKLEYDLFYLKNMSIFFDCAIVLKTIRIVFTGAGGR